MEPTINNFIGSTNSTVKNTGISMAEHARTKMNQLEDYLVANSSIGLQIFDFTTKEGIKALEYHINNKNEYEKLLPKLKEYLSVRKSLLGY